MTLNAGLIIYRSHAGLNEYLLVQSNSAEHNWYPPKGHLDAGEDVLKRAVRETHSITALRQDDDYEIRDENFKLEVNYSGDSKPKHVTYWLALLKKPYGPITLSLDEHQDFKWVTLEKIVETVNDNELAEAYNKVNAYLLENPKE